MTRLYDYTVIVRPEDNGTFVAYVPAIPGCHPWGQTPEEAQNELTNVFEINEELDIGQPELTDIVLKTVTTLDSGDTIEFLGVYAPEEYTRDIDNVLESPDFEDVALIDTDQDLYLTGLTWRHLVGETGEWTNRVYLRANDKFSAEGEAYPDLVPEGTPAEDIPVREQLITVTEKEKGSMSWP